MLTQHNLQSQRRSSVLVSVANHTGIMLISSSLGCGLVELPIMATESSTLEARPESRRTAEDRDSARLPCFEVRMARRGG